MNRAAAPTTAAQDQAPTALDLVFELAAELALLTDAAHELVTLPAGTTPASLAAAERMTARRVADSRHTLRAFCAWCNTGPTE